MDWFDYGLIVVVVVVAVAEGSFNCAEYNVYTNLHVIINCVDYNQKVNWNPKLTIN